MHLRTQPCAQRCNMSLQSFASAIALMILASVCGYFTFGLGGLLGLY